MAHTLGNSTVNRQAGISVYPDRIELRYILDLAEIPTLVERAEADTDADGRTSSAEWDSWAQRRALAVGQRLHLSAAGAVASPRVESVNWRLEPGEAGLDILRLTIRMQAPVQTSAATRLEYRDENHPWRAGWKEIFIAPQDGVRLVRADVPATDRSAGLTRFGGEPPLAFGLVHGFGFAGALAQELAGSEAHWLLPLAAFNAGIEAMQLALVIPALVALHVLRSFRWGVLLQRTASLGVATAGPVWLITRTASALG